MNIGIAVLGLVLLGWLFNHMQNSHWNVRLVSLLLSGYVLIQILPQMLFSGFWGWIKRQALTRSPPEAKRTASLQRRGLFDIVSPFTVVLAVLAYVLFAALMIALQLHHFFRGALGYRLLGVFTMAFAFNTFVLYRQMYRRKKWPLETPAYRRQVVEGAAKTILYVSIAAMVHGVLTATLVLLHLPRWAPFELSVFIVITMLFDSRRLFVLRRQAEADQFGPSPAS